MAWSNVTYLHVLHPVRTFGFPALPFRPFSSSEAMVIVNWRDFGVGLKSVGAIRLMFCGSERRFQESK